MHPRPSAAERVSRVLAWAVPFGVAAVRCSPFAQWRGDVAALRDIALIPMGYGGGVSTALAAAVELLPLGSKTLRTAFVSAAALAVVGIALHAIALRMLRALEPEGRPSRWTAPMLATLASLTATLTPLFQEEATIGGGAVIAGALAFGAIALGASALTDRDAPRPMANLVLAGLLAGSAAAERPSVGVAALVALATSIAALRFKRAGERVAVPWRVVTKMVTAAIAGAAIFSLPPVLRGIAPNGTIALGGPWRRPPPLHPDLGSTPRLIDAFTHEIGWVPLGLAAFGAALLVTRRSGRVILAGPMTLVAFDVVSRAALGTTPGTVGVRMLAIGCLACASTAGLFAGAGALVRMQVPLARASAALLVAFHATLVALVAETSAVRADRVAQRGPDVATALALDELPPSSAVVSGSPHWTWRLLTAQLVEGRRHDVVVVPRSLVARGRVAVELLAREKVAEAALLSLALTGTTDEAGLAALSDVRPLFLENERGWTDRVTSHLAIDGAWLRFRTDPPSRSDREAYLGRALDVLGGRFPSDTLASLDTDTRYAVGSFVRGHAKVLLKQGDAEGAGRSLAILGGAGPIDALGEGASYDVLFASAVARLPVVRHSADRRSAAERAKIEAAKKRAR